MPLVDEAWQEKVAGMVRAEMARRNISYRELAARLAAMGIPDNEKNLSTKISRGKFSAFFFLQCMQALGCRTIHIDRDD